LYLVGRSYSLQSIEIDPDYGGIKYEFKSYGSVAINKIGTPGGAAFTNQFKAYLADATDITKIQYIFDATKFSDVNAIKNRFKNLLETNADDLFKPVGEGGLGLTKMKQLFEQPSGFTFNSKQEFLMLLSNNTAFQNHVTQFIQL
jgi:hypothetical protein